MFQRQTILVIHPKIYVMTWHMFGVYFLQKGVVVNIKLKLDLKIHGQLITKILICLKNVKQY